MRIEDLRSTDGPTGRRVSARIVWEGAHRGPTSLWFETDPPFADDLEPTPEAFAVAMTPMASGLGEPRLLVEGPLCARLRLGMDAAMRILSRWYPSHRVVPVEATGGFVARRPRAPRRAAALVSGGVDSLSMLRANRRTYAEGHPAFLRDAVHLHGWHVEDLEGDVPEARRLRANAEQRERLVRLGEHEGFTVIPVRSNVRSLHPSYAFSRESAFGAGMVAIGHALHRRITDLSYASSTEFDGPPNGSHPLLDAMHSSGAVEIRPEEGTLPRLAKVASLATWTEGLRALQVCLLHEVPPPGQANCGRCEKCVRTRLELLAVGAQGHASAFPRTDVDPDDVRSVRYPTELHRRFARELLGPLRAVGRSDLADALESMVRRSRRREAWKRWRERLGLRRRARR